MILFSNSREYLLLSTTLKFKSNVYIPPASANLQYSPDISKLLGIGDDAIILGDLNAHQGAWYSSLSDSRGDSLVQQVEVSYFFILNHH
jgi:hypothetical protein